MDKPSISGQVRRAGVHLVGLTHWHRPLVGGMRWLITLALFSARASMAAPTILDFEDIAAGTTITTQYSDRGVVFGSYFLDTDSAAASGTRVLRTIPLGMEWFDPIPLVMTF